MAYTKDQHIEYVGPFLLPKHKYITQLCRLSKTQIDLILLRYNLKDISIQKKLIKKVTFSAFAVSK